MSWETPGTENLKIQTEAKPIFNISHENYSDLGNTTFLQTASNI